MIIKFINKLIDLELIYKKKAKERRLKGRTRRPPLRPAAEEVLNIIILLINSHLKIII